jgi:hypothetical protein
MKSYEFTYKLKTEAETKEDAITNFGLAINADTERNLLKVGKIKEIEKKNKKEDLIEFLDDHREEINGLYRDCYWRNGGWNGLMDSINEVERRYGFNFDYDILKDGEFEEIINNWQGR